MNCYFFIGNNITCCFLPKGKVCLQVALKKARHKLCKHMGMLSRCANMQAFSSCSSVDNSLGLARLQVA